MKLACKIVKVGTVGVDAGVVTIIDPAKMDKLPSFQEMVKKRAKFIPSRTCKAVGKGWNSHVTCQTKGGDGIFPVYATVCDGVVTKVEVRFEK
jgi:hypothetical protein